MEKKKLSKVETAIILKAVKNRRVEKRRKRLLERFSDVLKSLKQKWQGKESRTKERS